MHKMYVVMVGLPARGKSTLAERICHGLNQQGILTQIFNNGALRRELYKKESATPEFFRPNNQEGKKMRVEIAKINMDKATAWLAEYGKVAIIDATHGTLEQRNLILHEYKNYPSLFIECVNNDPYLLEASIRRKPDLREFEDVSLDEALCSFRRRIQYYMEVYVPLKAEPCWMRVEATENRILDEAPQNGLPYYAAIRDIISLRWVRHLYLVRHGQTTFNEGGRLGGDSALTAKGVQQAQLLAQHFQNQQIALSHVFTSTRLRTLQTASPVLEAYPQAVSMNFAEFDEINAGTCEGMRYDEIQRLMPEEYAKRAKNKYDYVYPNGESYALLKKRVVRGLRRALFLAGEQGLMIIGHQATNRAILSLFLFQRTMDVPYTYIPQNQYYHITVTQQRKMFEMIRYA